MSHIEVGNTIVPNEPSMFAHNIMDVSLFMMIVFAFVQIIRSLKQ